MSVCVYTFSIPAFYVALHSGVRRCDNRRAEMHGCLSGAWVQLEIRNSDCWQCVALLLLLLLSVFFFFFFYGDRE